VRTYYKPLFHIESAYPAFLTINGQVNLGDRSVVGVVLIP
jgi:hypothetical protein